RDTEPSKPSSRIVQAGPQAAARAECRGIPPAKFGRALRGDLDWITMKALEKDRARRYPTANALALDLKRYLRNEPVTAGAPGAIYRAGKFVRRHKVGVTVATTFSGLLLASSVIVAIQARRIALERDRARLQAATARQTSDFLEGLFKVSDPGEA